MLDKTVKDFEEFRKEVNGQWQLERVLELKERLENDLAYIKTVCQRLEK